MTTTTTPAWLDDTFAATVKTVQQIAAEAFAAHTLEETGPQEWRCARPGTGSYSFRVIVRPGTVIVWGDIGHAIFRGGEAGDTLAWLRSAVGSASYLREKLKHRERVFYPGDALEFARQCAEEETRYEPFFAAAQRAFSHGELDAHTWGDLVLEHLRDPEACSIGHADSAEAVWITEGLRWFVGPGVRAGGGE